MSGLSSEIFADNQRVNLPLPELLNGLGNQYQRLEFKNEIGQLQLSYHRCKLRFRLIRNNGLVEYSSPVSRLDRIQLQIEYFLSGSKNIQEPYKFFAVPDPIVFDFEEEEVKIAKCHEIIERRDSITRHQEDIDQRRSIAKCQEKLYRRLLHLISIGVSVTIAATLIIGGYIYFRHFQHLTIDERVAQSNFKVRVLYDAKQFNDAFEHSSLFDLLRAMDTRQLAMSNQLSSIQQIINQRAKFLSDEKIRLGSLSNEELIKEFPAETKTFAKTLSEIPKDVAGVYRSTTVKRQTYPSLSTADIAKAFNVSMADALTLKWDLNTKEGTHTEVISPARSYQNERNNARSTAIAGLLGRFETSINLQLDYDPSAFDKKAKEISEMLMADHQLRLSAEHDALSKIGDLGEEMPVHSEIRILRKSCLLIFLPQGLVYERQTNSLGLIKADYRQTDTPFSDYLARRFRKPARSSEE